MKTGMYEVPAGGRRFRRAAAPRQAKRLTKTSKVPCGVGRHADILVDEVSLAENIERARCILSTSSARSRRCARAHDRGGDGSRISSRPSRS